MDKLKAMTRWVCWKYETVKGKKTKVPYSPKTHQKCGSSPEYENAWVSYDEAIAGMATLDADGVELVIPKGYGALDRDHMSDDDPIVAEVRKLIPSYAETSPSGQGILMGNGIIQISMLIMQVLDWNFTLGIIQII